MRRSPRSTRAPTRSSAWSWLDRCCTATRDPAGLPVAGCASKDGRVTDWRDADLIRLLLSTPAPWAVVGLSANSERTAYRIGRYLRDRLGMSIVPVNLRGEDTLGETGYHRLADVPGPVDVVDCFVNSQRVGGVVDDAIAEKDRLGIKAVWLQLGVIDEDAARRGPGAGPGGVLGTPPPKEGA